MGNRATIATHVAKEIERLNEVLSVGNKDSSVGTTTAPSSSAASAAAGGGPLEPRKFLVLDQLPKMNQMREQAVDLQHIGILFVLDKGLKGWFDERDFLGLAETCLKRFEKWKEQNFQQQLQAYCTLQMWHVVCGSGGDELFSRWFGKLLEASTSYQVLFDKCKRAREKEQGFVGESSSEGEEKTPKAQRKKGKRKEIRYVSVASVHVIHKLLMLEELYGMSRTSFVGLCREVAEEKKIALGGSDTVPLPVLKDFAMEFVRGLTRLMHRLGFKRDTIVSEL